MKIYYLNRNERQELFKIGKWHKDNVEMDKDILHRQLLNLTKPNPSVNIRQINWWIVTARKSAFDVPFWLMEAYVTFEDD